MCNYKYTETELCWITCLLVLQICPRLHLQSTPNCSGTFSVPCRRVFRWYTFVLFCQRMNTRHKFKKLWITCPLLHWKCPTFYLEAHSNQWEWGRVLSPNHPSIAHNLWYIMNNLSTKQMFEQIVQSKFCWKINCLLLYNMSRSQSNPMWLYI